MKKILIVDDEQDIVESLKFVLEVSGFVCYTAFNGAYRLGATPYALT